MIAIPMSRIINLSDNPEYAEIFNLFFSLVFYFAFVGVFFGLVFWIFSQAKRA